MLLPPTPVANPTMPLVASISTQKEPRTLLIPQLVQEERYFSHRDLGVDMGVSINLLFINQTGRDASWQNSPMPTLNIVIISSRAYAIHDVGPDCLDGRSTASHCRSHTVVTDKRGNMRARKVKNDRVGI
jgi:hypothetical protein